MNITKENIGFSKEAMIASTQSLREKQYWTEKLAGNWEPGRFPCDYPYDYANNYNNPDTHIESGQKSAEPEKFQLEPELVSMLNRISGGNDPALHMILTAALALLIARYTGIKDFIIVTSIDKQERQGEFINTILPLRLQLQDDLTFKELLFQVKAVCDEAVRHQNYPVEILLHDQPGISFEHEQPFEVAIILENIQDRDYLNHIPLNLVFSFLKTPSTIQGVIEYNVQRYVPSTIQRIIRHMKQLLGEALHHVNLKITEIDILSAAEKKKLLVDFNSPAIARDFPDPCTIQELFNRQVERNIDRVALSYGETEEWGTGLLKDIKSKNIFNSSNTADYHLTYKELNRKSQQLAELLKEKGVGIDSIVAIMAERSAELLIGLLGILKANGAYLPIDQYYPPERIDYMLSDSQPQALVTTRSIAGTTVHEANPHRQSGENIPGPGNRPGFFTDRENIRKWKDAIVFIDEVPAVHQESPRTAAAVCQSSSPIPGTVDSLAYIIYTSGSTGLPKGVLIEHRGVVNLVWCHRLIFGESSRSRISQTASPAFDAMASEIWPCLLNGGNLVIAGDEIRMHPQRLKEWLIRHQISNSYQPTLMAMDLLAEPWPETGISLEVLRTAGDRLTRYPCRPYPFRFYNLYGPTEDTVWTTWADVPIMDNPLETPNYPPIGKPVANHWVYILDPGLKLQPLGVPGELCISGIGIARGYLNRPRLTLERFVNYKIQHTNYKQITTYKLQMKEEEKEAPGNWLKRACKSRLYKTGDLVRWLADGNIEFLGRQDRQVKIRGYRVEPEEIEHQLIIHPQIKEAVVLDKHDSSGSHYLCAYLVRTGETSLNIMDIKTYLSARVPDYMLPAYFLELKKIPLTINGKIDRNQLLKYEESHSSLQTVYTPPVTEMEKKIANAWKEVLQADRVDVNDNFFDIGGNSVNIIKVSIKLEKILNREIAVIELFRYPTIRTLARNLQNLMAHPLAPEENQSTENLSSLEKMDNRIDIMQETSRLLLGDDG